MRILINKLVIEYIFSIYNFHLAPLFQRNWTKKSVHGTFSPPRLFGQGELNTYEKCNKQNKCYKYLPLPFMALNLPSSYELE